MANFAIRLAAHVTCGLGAGPALPRQHVKDKLSASGTALKQLCFKGTLI
jgi:hypothetical protein